MAKNRFVFWVLLISGFNILLIRAVGPTSAGQEMSPQVQRMMEQMAKYGTPGQGHEFLKKYAGDWDVAITSWPMTGGQPQTSRGTMKNTLLFDGRYVKGEFEGAMGGASFKGLEIIGYDLYAKRYTTVWVDSMSTAILTLGGTLDASGRVLTETGTAPDPMTDGKTQQKFKNVTTFMADGTYKFEMFMVGPDGRESKGLELLCTRRK
jgi:hypothetical protein